MPADRQPDRWRAWAALALAVAGIAWSAIFVRWAAIPGVASAFYRVSIAAVVLVPWRIGRGATRQVSGRAVALALAGGVFFALDLAFWNTAVMRTNAAIASLLGNGTPIFVGLMTWGILGRRPSGAFWTGLALAAVGCGAIASADLFRVRAAHAGSLGGDALAIAASVFFAAYLTTTERIRATMDTLTFSTLAIAASVATLAAICLASGVPLRGYPPRTWAALAGLGLVSQLGAYFALVGAMGRLPATVTSVGLLAQVPCTALLAILLLGEPLSSLQIAGGAVVLVGIYVVTRNR